MPHYEVHHLNTHGRIVSRFEFHCTNDAEAELACEDLSDQGPKELWCGPRWIRAWPAQVCELRKA